MSSAYAGGLPTSLLPLALPEHAARTASAVPLQASWLLLALCQDWPANRHLQLFREKCEQAALTGQWVSGAAAPTTLPSP